MVKLAVLPKEEKLKLTTMKDSNHNFRPFLLNIRLQFNTCLCLYNFLCEVLLESLNLHVCLHQGVFFYGNKVNSNKHNFTKQK